MGTIKDLFDYITRLLTWWVVIMPWEQGIRVRLGKHLILLNKGIYLKLPLIDTVFVQEKRLRMISLPMQTLSTRDNHTITISSTVGYSIIDIIKLYNTLYQPDMTIGNILMSKLSEFITSHELKDCKPNDIEEYVTVAILKMDYGLKFESIKIFNFASVKTFRLIQDGSWFNEGLTMTSIK